MKSRQEGANFKQICSAHIFANNFGWRSISIIRKYNNVYEFREYVILQLSLDHMFHL